MWYGKRDHREDSTRFDWRDGDRVWRCGDEEFIDNNQWRKNERKTKDGDEWIADEEMEYWTKVL